MKIEDHYRSIVETAEDPIFIGARERRDAEERGSYGPRGGTKTILLVEDEPALLRLATRSLESLGYTVLAASRPDDAIAIVREHQGPVHMLLNGRRHARNERPEACRSSDRGRSKSEVRVHVGHTDGVMGHGGLLDQPVHFLQKPFSPKALADKVRDVLEG